MSATAGESAPLTGRLVAVVGDDPALRHARMLLQALGARVVDEPIEGADFALALDDSQVRPDIPTVRTAGATASADWAASGAMCLTGRADGATLLAPGAPASAVRGALLLLRALALFRGARVAAPWPDVTVLGQRAALAGLHRQGPRSAGGAYRPLPAADGWVGLSLARPDDYDLLPALLEGPVDGDPWDAVSRWASCRSSAEVASRAQLLGLAAAPVALAAAYDDEQARARGGDRPVPYVCSRGETRTAPSAPVVVDLTSLWAGPLCAHLLGLAGAHVVKVESVERPDGGRWGSREFYDLLHAGHASVMLELSTPGGRRALAALIAEADVVIEASRPRALRQLGIVAEDVVAAGTTWTSITAYGRRGPWANRVGYGDDVAAAAGLVAVDDGVPMPCGDAIADPLAGVHAAVATAATLLSDAAYLVDVSMRDVAASTLVHGGDADPARTSLRLH